MNVEITTTDPTEVDPVAVARLLDSEGYYVASVVVLDRMNVEHRRWEEDDGFE